MFGNSPLEKAVWDERHMVTGYGKKHIKWWALQACQGYVR